MNEPQVPSTSKANVVIDVDEEEMKHVHQKFKILCEMFPNAQENFLWARSMDYAWENSGFEIFLEEVMLNDEYPVKPTTPAEESDANDWVKFDLQAFLKKFPDPVKHFTENPYGVRYVEHTYNFLLGRYFY